MLKRMQHFFKRFVHPKVDEQELEGVKHMIGNIDEGFDADRPKPKEFAEQHRDSERS